MSGNKMFKVTSRALVPAAAKAVRKEVRKELNKAGETYQKSASWGFSQGDVGIGAYDVSLVDIDQGDDQFERSGNQVVVTGYYIRQLMTYADATNLFRVIIYIPKDTSTTLTGIALMTPVDLDRFTILYDKLVMLDNSDSRQMQLTITKKFRKK